MKKKKTVAKVVGESVVDKTSKVHQRENLGYKLNIAKVDWTPKQQEYIDMVRDADTKIVFVKGCAGTGKTLLNMAIALELLNIGRIKEIICARSVVESSSVGMGYLPGSQEEKLAPYAIPFMDKLKMLLNKNQIDLLLKDERIQFIPINFLRGREFNASFILLDESQNLVSEEISTMLTRYGKYSKLILAGDSEQSDIESFRKSKSGFKPLYVWFDNPIAVSHGIKCFKFGIEDIKREPVIGYIVEEYTKYKAQNNLNLQHKM